MLELGCGDAGNLVADGASRCRARASSGVDAAPRAIARGRAARRRARAGQRDARGAARSRTSRRRRASFDYVIAHGVYSWVAPRGARSPARASAASALRRRTAWPTSATTPCPADACARRCATCSSSTPPSSPTRASASRRRGRCCASCSRARRPSTGSGRSCATRPSACSTARDASLLHDELAEVNDAALLPRVRRARRRATGCSTSPRPTSSRCRSARPPSRPREALLAVEDPVRREQYLDFLKGRMFRQTLLCRAELAIDRTPRPEVIERLAVSTQAAAPGRARPDGAQAFEGPTGSTLTTDHPLVIDALERAARAWPAALWVRDLLGPRGDAGRAPRAVRRAAAQLRRQPRRPPRRTRRALTTTPGRRPADHRARAPPGRAPARW